jgi:hypothetical protein
VRSGSCCCCCCDPNGVAIFPSPENYTCGHAVWILLAFWTQQQAVPPARLSTFPHVRPSSLPYCCFSVAPNSLILLSHTDLTFSQLCWRVTSRCVKFCCCLNTYGRFDHRTAFIFRVKNSTRILNSFRFPLYLFCLVCLLYALPALVTPYSCLICHSFLSSSKTVLKFLSFFSAVFSDLIRYLRREYHSVKKDVNQAR